MSCCERMRHWSNVRCPHHLAFDCPDVLLIKKADGYALPIRDGGSSWVPIHFCPWCGTPTGSVLGATKQGFTL